MSTTAGPTHRSVSKASVFRSTAFVLTILMLAMSALPAFAEPPAPALGTEGFEPLPPPEQALFKPSLTTHDSWFARSISMAGSGLGLGTTAFGLYSIALSISEGQGTVSMHEGLAITVSGTVLAALSSAIYAIFSYSINDPSAE